MKDIMKEYSERGLKAKEKGQPVAWVTAVFPVELIYAANLFPYYPENFGAVAAAKKIAHELSAAAEGKGYASDLCGYARCGIGDAFSEKHPVGKILEPDLLFC